MLQKRVAHLLWSLILVALLLLELPVGAQAVSPAATWSAANVMPVSTFVHGNGAVTFASCNMYSYPNGYAAVTLDSSGVVIGKIPWSVGAGTQVWRNNVCGASVVAGNDDTFFVSQYNDQGQVRLVAYKRGVMAWTYLFKQCGATSGLGVQDLVMGSNGGVYALLVNIGSGICSTTISLVSFNAATGALKFQADIASSGNDGLQQLFVQSRGVVIKTTQEIFFVNYDGKLRASETISVPAGQSISYVAVNDKETVSYIVVGAAGSSISAACPGMNWQQSLIQKQGAANPVELSLSSCGSISGLWMKPDGKILYSYYAASAVTNAGENRLLQRAAGGISDFDIPLGTLSGYEVEPPSFMLAGGVTVSDKGDIYIRRQVRLLSAGARADTNIRIDKVASTGFTSKVLSTDALDNPAVSQYYGVVTAEDGGLAGGKLYVPYCLGAECNSGMGTGRIAVLNITPGYDYPRFAVAKQTSAQLNYVALGDSFSSGEGVPPFETTSSPDKDLCHRSTSAYSRVLDSDTALALTLQAFRACSGATTEQVIAGKNTETGQLDAITNTTKIITISVGGNDIGFEPYIAACLTPFQGGCGAGSSIYSQTLDNIELSLPNKLDAFYVSLEKKLDSVKFTGRVYVVGYPRMIVERPVGGWGLCPIELSQDEAFAAESLTVKLDSEIAGAVARLKDSRFNYVSALKSGSPFTGHDMCSTAPYFNNFDPLHKEYTAHPNQKGQAAYAKIIKDYGVG